PSRRRGSFRCGGAANPTRSPAPPSTWPARRRATPPAPSSRSTAAWLPARHEALQEGPPMTSSGHDHHGDHTHGNHLFRPAAVIGHAALSDPQRIVGNLHRAFGQSAIGRRAVWPSGGMGGVPPTKGAGAATATVRMPGPNRLEMYEVVLPEAA